MNHLPSTLSTGWYALQAAPGPPDAQQLARSFGQRTQQLIADFAWYGLLVTGFIVVIYVVGLLTLLVYEQPLVRLFTLLPRPHRRLRPGRSSRFRTESRIAKANKHALRVASARIKAGQLSN